MTEDNIIAPVAQRPFEHAHDVDTTSVAGLERRGVSHDHRVLPCGQNRLRTRRDRDLDALAELHVEQVDRVAGLVVQLDELEVRGREIRLRRRLGQEFGVGRAVWIVVQFGDDQVAVSRRVDVERSLVQRAPFAANQAACPEACGLGQYYRLSGRVRRPV